MRLSSLIFTTAAFLFAGVFCVLSAGLIATLIEESSKTEVRRALDNEGLVWADTDADGLNVFVFGTAPDEAERFHALTVAGTVIDASRVIDQMEVSDSATGITPTFSIEILRNARGISVFGLVPSGDQREDITRALSRLAGDSENLSDLLAEANFPSNEDWDEAVRYAIAILRDLPDAKVSVREGQVVIEAMTDSADVISKIEADILRRKPENVSTNLKITAPRPVISPFSMRIRKEAETVSFETCAASTRDDVTQIMETAKQLFEMPRAHCAIGLGAPNEHWVEATESAMQALQNIENGTISLKNNAIRFVAGADTSEDAYQATITALQTNLPPAYILSSTKLAPKSSDQGVAKEFTAIKSPEGLVQLRGPMPSEQAKMMLRSLANARFGSENVAISSKVISDADQNWSTRIFAAVEALSELERGSVEISNEAVSVNGLTHNPETSAMIAALLGDKLSEETQFTIDVEFEEPPQLEPDKLDPKLCIKQINGLLEIEKINFEPGSDRVDLAGQKLLDRIAEVILACEPMAIEISGHTDSQGREEMNLALSQSRATAVLGELQRRRVLTGDFEAKGYGEALPIAPNDTEEGREKNRRIEFRLKSATPQQEDQ
jgi:OOP family OmpA-OmpF porin